MIIYRAVYIVFQILIWLLIANALLSWFAMAMYRSGNYTHIFVRLYTFTNKVTEPLVRPSRRLLSRFNTGPIDFSVMVTILVLIAVQSVVMRILAAVLV